MKHSMLKSFAVGLALLSLSGSALAAHGEGKIPEVVELHVVQTEQPEALPDPRPVLVTEHDISDKDVEKLARLLWSSPLRDETEKKKLVYVVMNRAAYGEPFADTISGCINIREFSFFDAHAHRSEENKRIVREAMNEWLSRKEGNNVGHIVPINAYYVRFVGAENREIQLLDINRRAIG